MVGIYDNLPMVEFMKDIQSQLLELKALFQLKKADDLKRACQMLEFLRWHSTKKAHEFGAQGQRMKGQVILCFENNISILARKG